MGFLRRAVEAGLRTLVPEILGQLVPEIRTLGSRLYMVEQDLREIRAQLDRLEAALDLPEPPSFPSGG